MVRKRVAVTGRFVKEGSVSKGSTDEPSGDEAAGKVKGAGGKRVGAPRPRHCRTFTRARFAEALPEIAETLLKQAKKGSVAHLKLLVQLSGLDRGELVPKAQKRKGKSVTATLLEEWRREPPSGTDG